MTWGLVDRLIDREVGELCLYLLPHLKPGLKVERSSERFRRLQLRDDGEELRRVEADNPLVPYPVLLLDSDRQLDSLSGLIYPPHRGAYLRLSDYLKHLRRFLILQMTAGDEATTRLIQRAIADYSGVASQDELVELVDQLWRGRWIVGGHEWAFFRLWVLAGGDEEALAAYQADQDGLQAAAMEIIQEERKLKNDAACMEEWLHGIYSLLPKVLSILTALRRSNEARPSDEVEKFDRVLDEFQADIGTTLHFGFDEDELFDIYIRSPLIDHEDVDAGIKHIRGIYRGRTIVPRVWSDALVETRGEQRSRAQPAASGGQLADEVRAKLQMPDGLAGFGRALCVYRDPWMLVAGIEHELAEED
ncbi:MULTISPECIES: hypothetical protein [Rhizobium]|uniref:hypothetical protein n=1 Tax=Rhizobium TaxID=379 RepID=UPI0014429ED2|nr:MULTISPECIES: hypothetical protein [Rhizobium]NKL04186.1 hypothetical protein [Rhizobium leguminosarum bv. viciae]NKL85578.1 hypothetical protein [Rhizobium leguminosarum bv. viciae]NKL89350.1 hypothetical protein [Rhizobium leguminosarum bv. viciae]NKM70832.1 hypothetical protein [Rhizobium laguerreae]NKM90318.1 hypothetical protein [Rhizobium leguminosarum bv. viciae]